MTPTELGRTYAQIVGGILVRTFTIADMLEYDEEEMEVVDITGTTPTPELGDEWDGVLFSEPRTPVEDRRRTYLLSVIDMVQSDVSVPASIKSAMIALRALFT